MTGKLRNLVRLFISLVLVVVICLMNLPAAWAQDLNPKDYFQLSYDPVTFDKTEVNGEEVFHVTVAGRANCTQDLPVSASEASITSRVIARHTTSNAMVTLNASHIVTIKPFPSKAGETAEISQAIPLQFPATAESGEYATIVQITEAIVKVGIIPVTVTEFLPREQAMGTVKYTAADSPPIRENQRELTPEPKPIQIIPWWMVVISCIAIVTTAFNIVWFLRQRRSHH